MGEGGIEVNGYVYELILSEGYEKMNNGENALGGGVHGVHGGILNRYLPLTHSPLTALYYP